MSGSILRIAVLASGAGTTLQAIIDACERGELAAAVVVVIGNNSGSGSRERADRHGIEFVHLSGQTHADPEALDLAIRDELIAHQPDIVVLAGYMKKLGPKTLARFGGRVINTHPSLLPLHGGKGMYGLRVHEAVIAASEKKSGISVHLVDDEYDTGAVLAQCEVDVNPGDSARMLADRVQSRERPFLVEVLRRISKGDITLPTRNR